MLLPPGNPFKCHEEVLFLQPMIPSNGLDISPLTGGCSEGLDVLLWDLRVEYPGTWLQRLWPADVRTAELARRWCSCRMGTLVDAECAHAANKDL